MQPYFRRGVLSLSASLGAARLRTAAQRRRTMPSSTEDPVLELPGRLAAVRCGALMLAVVLASSAARGQEPAPVRLDPATLARGEAIDLERAWRFHPGDDPRWSDPAFD